LVGTTIPGVRKDAIQVGGVRMAASIGSIKPPGRFVRKSLFGSRFDPISAGSSQLPWKRSAIHPETSRQKNPSRMMKRIMDQSR
jgi:hypothetical protein